MGNVVGEKFDNFVIGQINARQSLAGKGFGEATLSPSDLLILVVENMKIVVLVMENKD